jgi:hypothetical protein
MKTHTNPGQPEFTTESYGHDEWKAFRDRLAELNKGRNNRAFKATERPVRVRSFQASGSEESFSISFHNGVAYDAERNFAAIF